MNGDKYMASPFAASFRRHLWRQHLGLIPPQECTPETAAHYPTDAMRPAPHANPDPVAMAHKNEWERLVEDPLSDELEKMWKGQATSNTDIADEIFQVVPSDKVRRHGVVCMGACTADLPASGAKLEAVRRVLHRPRCENRPRSQ